MIADKSSLQLNPAALTVEDLAKMLGLPAEIVHKHVEEGAPIAPDGTLNLVVYAAWLNSRITHGD
jgi:plasmid maintenance system antidote protein VapI